MSEFKLLRVNLSSQKVREERVDEKTLRRFLGGRGLGAYLALKEIPKGADPLGPENKLFIMSGPVTGTAEGFEAGRTHFVGKSPLTGLLGESNMGGRFAPWMRYSGYDGIVLEGKSDEPVWISVIDGEVKFHSAKEVWGRGTHYTEYYVKKQLNAKPNEGAVLAIGPAGENGVRFASLIHAGGRAGGRTGLGAVMGSKKVKAIYVYGTRKPEVVDEERFKKGVEHLKEKIGNHPVKKALNSYGTAVLVNIINKIGALPTKNWRKGTFEKAEEISGERMAEKYLVKTRGCWGCQIECGRLVKTYSPEWGVPEGSKGPEYETIFAIGSNLELSNLEAIIRINHVLNDLGMDTIEFGNTVAVLMELYERAEELGEKSEELKKLLDGLRPVWGVPNPVLELAYKVANRDGIGNVMANGAKALAEAFGCDCVAEARGMSLPAYDPRAIKAMALAYATSNRGGCHLRAYAVSFEVLGIPVKTDPLEVNKEKAKMVKEQQDFFASIDSMIVCKFNTFMTPSPEDYVDLLAGVTGWDVTADEIMEIGERIYNVERLFNVREGDPGDYLSKRLLEEALPDGPAKGETAKEALEVMLPAYYEYRGWEDGKPTEETLKRLGLQEFLYII
ncbi:aldehyde ferredoxin oxidoreductase family protein [Ignicoccus hospitalis]|uniref:Aldehyde ferredoxin oxidoreductase n=1 Tax=Ignicoccus hospitalis (strain KIN4/I / DSM 18386 / JCM 14125) TaxID=453591 RepID=A8ABA9_IGNH4|nr:aldehyde ferredoxin oxidoreductase family protein [Ignicoccus hospitalis]ABU82211.1 Aldehyde ferredoxin oxidoreductase [Ignicoccus hospitalis KIN4/I]HIH90147.1 aldehyde ferredoxin oxidoreductase family protein [Desulfurococcaceae archaeon]